MSENSIQKKNSMQLWYPWLVAAVAVGMVVCGGLWSSGQSLTNAALREQLGLTGTQTSSLTTCKSLSAFIIVLFFDKWYTKLGLRFGVVGGLLLGAVGEFISANAGTNLIMYYIGAIVGGFCYGLCMAAGASLIANAWFNKHKGLVLGICASGSGLSSMIFSPIVQSTIHTKNVSAAYNLEGFILVTIAVLALLILRDTPDKMGLEPYGGKDYIPTPGKKKNGPTKPHTVFLSNAQIWTMTAIIILLGVAGANSAAHIPVVLNDYHIDPAAIGWGASVFGLCMIIGKVGFGFVGDAIGYKITSVIYALLAMIGYGSLVTLVFAQPTYIAYVSYIFAGLGCSLCMMGYPLWATDWAKKEDYTTTLKRFQMAYQFGVLIAGSLAGAICDWTGTYAWYFLVPVAGYGLTALGAVYFYNKLDKMRQAAGDT